MRMGAKGESGLAAGERTRSTLLTGSSILGGGVSAEAGARPAFCQAVQPRVRTNISTPLRANFSRRSFEARIATSGGETRFLRDTRFLVVEITAARVPLQDGRWCRSLGEGGGH